MISIVRSESGQTETVNILQMSAIPTMIPITSSTTSKQPKFKLPLRSLLIVPFVLQTFAAVGLVGYFSFKNGQQAVNDLAVQLQNEVSDRINC